jgi:hypothetical protein
MPSNNEIKEVIRDFVSFDIEKNFYQKEDKEELVRKFKQIIFEDDVTVRKFLKSFFDSTKKLADQYSLIAKEGETTEEELDDKEENEQGEPTEEMGDEVPTAETDEKKEESYRIYRTVASNILYD